MQHQVNIAACIAWNRERMERAMARPNSESRKEAKHYAENISQLEKQL